jgi:hypothetical protein
MLFSNLAFSKDGDLLLDFWDSVGKFENIRSSDSIMMILLRGFVGLQASDEQIGYLLNLNTSVRRTIELWQNGVMAIKAALLLPSYSLRRNLEILRALSELSKAK